MHSLKSSKKQYSRPIVKITVRRNNSSAVAEMDDRLATIDMGRKVREGLLCPFPWRELDCWVPSNTLWSGPRPASVPSGILIHPTVWPQCTNVTDRQDRTGQDRTDRTAVR